MQLEHELEEATSNSIEMHKMLSEMLSAQKDTSTFQVWRNFTYYNSMDLYEEDEAYITLHFPENRPYKAEKLNNE